MACEINRTDYEISKLSCRYLLRLVGYKVTSAEYVWIWEHIYEINRFLCSLFGEHDKKLLGWSGEIFFSFGQKCWFEVKRLNVWIGKETDDVERTNM